MRQVEELQKKAEDTARAWKAVSAKNQELEARMHHLSASASSSEQELRSEAAEVSTTSTPCSGPKVASMAVHLSSAGLCSQGAHGNALLKQIFIAIRTAFTSRFLI